MLSKAFTLVLSYLTIAAHKLISRINMQIETKARQIFRIAETKEDTICPPDQVFANPDFVFLLTIGGHLADGDDEYQKLMKLLKELGETEFHILENIGSTLTEKKVPYHGIVSVDTNFEYFDSVGKSFDENFGLMPYSFFIFGNKKNWGIYICEHPTINIIGCTKELAQSFAKVFQIEGNGFLEQVDFLAQEYQHKGDLLGKLVKNYHLKN